MGLVELLLGVVFTVCVGLGFGLGAMGDAGGVEFIIARAAFAVAAIAVAGAFFYWLSEGDKDNRLIVIFGIVAGLLVFIGLPFSQKWLTIREAKLEALIKAAENKAPPTTGAQILFDCRFSKLPAEVPPSGNISTMMIIEKSESGGEPVLLGDRHGNPGEKLTWFDDLELPPSWRCDITNYSDFPIFNLHMLFKTEFRPLLVDKENPNAGHSGEVFSQYDRPVILTKIDPKSTISFWAYSQSKFFAMVHLPAKVTYWRSDMGSGCPKTCSWSTSVRMLRLTLAPFKAS
jgi:hypothetical protein